MNDENPIQIFNIRARYSLSETHIIPEQTKLSRQPFKPLHTLYKNERTQLENDTSYANLASTVGNKSTACVSNHLLILGRVHIPWSLLNIPT